MNPTITVMSMFRDSMEWAGIRHDHVSRHCDILTSQKDVDITQCVWLEGDSKDDTFKELSLRKAAHNAVLLKQDTQEPFYGSIDSVKRLENLSMLDNIMRDAVLQLPPTDFIIFIESDLIVTDLCLFSTLCSHNVDVVAPLPYLGHLFYDTWGFIGLKGEGWSNHRPFSKMLRKPGRLLPMMCVGSMLCMKWEVMTKCKWGKTGFRSFCQDAREHDFKIFADREARVDHPHSGMPEGRWI